MDESEYLKTRVEKSIDWYDRESKRNQRWYKGFRIIEIVAAASIPFLIGYVTDATPCIGAIVGLLGVLIAIITAVLSLCRFQEKWVEYRTTCEALKHEKWLYLTKTEPYNIDTPFLFFVRCVESIILRENTMWSQYIRSQNKDNR